MPNPFPDATIRLLENGRPPRRRLRYAWKVGQPEKLTLDIRTSLSSTADAKADIPLPAVRTVVDLTPERISSDGTLTYTWRVASGEVTTAEGIAAKVAEGMGAEVAAIEHLSGTGELSSRGLSKSLSINPSTHSDDAPSRPIAQQVLQTLWNVAAPLPEEDVGVGARWRRVSQLAVKTSSATQTDLFTLLTLGEARGSLDDVLGQTAPHQMLSVPGLGRGARAQMESMLASGDAKTDFALSRIVPRMNFKGVTTMVLSGDAPSGAEPPSTMVLRVEIDVTGAPR